MSVSSNLREGSYEWLIAILLSWWVPFQLIGEFRVTYFLSLLLWGLPVLLLLPRFLSETHRGSRRRQAFWYSTAYILGAGAILDLIFGARILCFSDCTPQNYIHCIPAVGGKVPIEEILFYLLGGAAIVLIYCWADQHWLSRYNVRCRRSLIPAPGHLIDLSPRVALLAGGLLLAGVFWKATYDPHLPVFRAIVAGGLSSLPTYYTFLVITAFVPLALLYRGVSAFVNWRALSLTGLYVMLTAAVWEVTLALPNGWWFYRSDAMIGKSVPAWSSHERVYPIEALFIWIAVTFVAIFVYEAAEAFFYDLRPWRERLFGGRDPNEVYAESPELPIDEGISIIIRSREGSAARAVRLLLPALRTGRLDRSVFEVMVALSDSVVSPTSDAQGVTEINTEDAAGWRALGASATSRAILCFMDVGLVALPSVFAGIQSVLESPRIVGGSTSVGLEAPMAVRLLRAIGRVPLAWITGYDRGIVFCRRADFNLLDESVIRGDTRSLLEALRRLGRRDGRVITRLAVDGVVQPA